MPKITATHSRPFRSYDPLSRLSLEDSKAPNNSLLIDTSFIWNNEEVQKYHNYTQDAVFLQEAARRACGLHKLQAPLIDHFQSQGRTIYNAYHKDQKLNDDNTTFDPLSIIADVLALSAMIEQKNDAEPHTPPRRRSTSTRSRVHSARSSRNRTPSLEDTDPFHLSSPSAQQLQPRTLFLAINQNNEVEFIPERVVLVAQTHFEEAEWTSDPFGTPNAPESPIEEVYGDSSRCSTPSLSWSDSVNSSPRTDYDPTEGWNAGNAGPTRERIDAINHGVADGKPTDFDFLTCADSEEQSLGHLFDLYINTEDCEIF